MRAFHVPGFAGSSVVIAAVLVAMLSSCSTQESGDDASTSGTGTGGSPTNIGASATGGTGASAVGSGGTAAPGSGGSSSVGQNPGGTGGASSGTGTGGSTGLDAGSSGAGGSPIATDGGSKPAESGADDAGSEVAGKACHSTADWTAQSGDIWISPSGNDSSDGSKMSPKKNLSAAISAWSSGKTIWVMPGTYAVGAPISLSTKATSSGELRISGVSGGAKPVFDFSSEPRATNNDGQRGFQISGSYVHLRYLEVAKASDNCVYVTGSNNTLEWLSVHECQDTGVQLSSGASSNKVLNVDSYLNADPTGENADGFAPKLSIGQDNYFCGTRSYQNADDGYDCWSSGDSSPVTFEYCWAFGQPGPTATANGDGNGFKLGSPASLASGGNAPHKLINCFAFENRSTGFTANGNSSGKITCTNCGVWGNGTAWSPGTGGVVPQHTGDITNLSVSVDKAMNAPRDASGNLPDITKL
jgi:hypothetical protein